MTSFSLRNKTEAQDEDRFCENEGFVLDKKKRKTETNDTNPEHVSRHMWPSDYSASYHCSLAYVIALETWYRPVPDKLANNCSSLILSIFTISEQNCTGPLFVYCGSFSGLIEKLPDGTALILCQCETHFTVWCTQPSSLHQIQRPHFCQRGCLCCTGNHTLQTNSDVYIVGTFQQWMLVERCMFPFSTS